MTIGKFTCRLTWRLDNRIDRHKSYGIIMLWNKREFFKVFGYYTYGKRDRKHQRFLFAGIAERYITLYKRGLP